MIEFISNYYLWIKACHIISIICWMAGLLYLPRLFVYHTQTAFGSETDKMLQVMEHRLLRYIMNPSMIASFIFGGMLLFMTDFAPWLHIKLTLVLLMAVLHGAMAYYRKQFVREKNAKSQVFFRFFNEYPAILMVIIVILAVIKPL